MAEQYSEADCTRVHAYALPGHDRDSARAIHAQAAHRTTPLDRIQVEHLLAIGYRAGHDAALRAFEGRMDLVRKLAAGRREYAQNAPEFSAVILEAEANAYDAAVKVLEGDDGPLYGGMPSWRWTPEMVAKLDEGNADA